MRLFVGVLVFARHRVEPPHRPNLGLRAAQTLASSYASTCEPCSLNRRDRRHRQCPRLYRSYRGPGMVLLLGVVRQNRVCRVIVHRALRRLRALVLRGAEHLDVALPGVVHPDEARLNAGRFLLPPAVLLALLHRLGRLVEARLGAECFRGSGACPFPDSTRKGCCPDVEGAECPFPGSTRRGCCLGVEHQALVRRVLARLAFVLLALEPISRQLA